MEQDTRRYNTMIAKYQRVMDSMHNYIYNAIQVEERDSVIVMEVKDRYPSYIAFYKVDTEMIQEFLEQLVKYTRKTYNITNSNIRSIYEKQESSCNVTTADSRKIINDPIK